jgi:hypothetical protein
MLISAVLRSAVASRTALGRDLLLGALLADDLELRLQLVLALLVPLLQLLDVLLRERSRSAL